MVTVKVRSLGGNRKGNNKNGILIDCTSKFRKFVGGEVLYRTCFSSPYQRSESIWSRGDP